MENTEKKLGFSTRQIHVGKFKNGAGALCDPIYQTSTFAFETVEQGSARFAGTEAGYVYSRPANPSTNAVEAKIASHKNGEAGISEGLVRISTGLEDIEDIIADFEQAFEDLK